MALHGLAEMTLGVPDVAAAREFYTEFGLDETGSGVFATRDGGDQLRLVATPYRRLVEFTIAADDADDLARIRAAAAARDLPVTDGADGDDITIVEPVVGIRARAVGNPRLA